MTLTGTGIEGLHAAAAAPACEDRPPADGRGGARGPGSRGGAGGGQPAGGARLDLPDRIEDQADHRGATLVLPCIGTSWERRARRLPDFGWPDAASEWLHLRDDYAPNQGRLALRSRGKAQNVPLYSCQRCGWATASSWRDAVQGHEAGCPSCSGSVELVPLAGRPQENIAAVDRVGRPFEMRERSDLDGVLRLTLLGGLDIIVTDRLTSRLRTLRATLRPVRIDLSELEFIDCSGLEAIIDELAAARRLGQSLEVDRPVSAPVKRVITFMDASAVLWPPDADGPPAPLRVIEGAGEAEPEHVEGVRRPREPSEAPPLGLVVGEASDRAASPPGPSVSRGA